MNLNCHEHEVAGKTIEPSTNVIRMHHYHCKSWEEYLKKATRGDAWNGAAGGMYKYQRACFDEHDKNDVYDFNLAKYVDPIKEELEKNKKI